MSGKVSSRQRFGLFIKDHRSSNHRNAARNGTGPAGPSEANRRCEFHAPKRNRAQNGSSHLRAYLVCLRPYRFRVATLLGLALMSVLVQMAEPLFMRSIIDKVLLNPHLERTVKVHRLGIAGTLFLAVVIASNLVSGMREYWQRLVSARVMAGLRRRLFRKLLHLPLLKLWDMKTGGVLSLLTSDVDATIGFMQMTVVLPAMAAMRLVVVVAALISINWRLALTALAVVPGLMLIGFVLVGRIRPVYRGLRQDLQKLDGRVAETFSGIRVVRAFRREVSELSEYVRGRHTIVRKELFAQRREIVTATSSNLLMAGLNVAIVCYGGYLNIQGGASIGDIMACQWYATLLLSPVLTIISSFSDLQRSLAAMERVFEVLALDDDKPDRPEARLAPAAVTEIRFENVGFHYQPGRPVIRDFNVVVPSGSTIALVGRSGSGKTTIIDLLARFHDPTEGRILLNGHDIREFRLGSYRNLIAFVHQDVFLFDGSVRDNLAYGREDATEAEIRKAARSANAHEFIIRLPKQYDTVIGERGVKLSGGQRQRLAIGRAILSSAQILILDEATSNLDTESERLIRASTLTLLSGRTTFVIAHRLSTVRRAGLILLMDEGRIIETGNHEELMRLGGAYHKMVTSEMESDDVRNTAARKLRFKY